MNTIFAQVHEYETISPKLARITASLTRDHLSQQAVYAALQDNLGAGITPVKDSFRWIDEAHTAVVGYVYAANQVKYLPKGEQPTGFREVASNIFMDETDKSMWDMKQGAGGKYLAKQGSENLSAMLETARMSPRGSQPRMAHVLRATVAEKELCAYVSEGRRTADMDYGVVLGKAENGALMVLSHMTSQPVTVAPELIVASYTIDAKGVPPLPKAKVDALLQQKRIQASLSKSAVDRVNAADVYSPHLTPQEYWTLQYSYAPEYLAKVLQQVNEMAAA